MELTKDNFRSEYIHGDRFRELADFTLTADYPILSSDIFERDGIIFCDGDFVLALFKALNKSNKRYILITHNSDLNITNDVYSQKPACVKYWFAQNVCTNKKYLQPIPIGLEREHIVQERDVQDTVLKKIIENYDIKKKFAYLNINRRTNRLERNSIYYNFFWRWWVTSAIKRSYGQYINDIASHKFIFSPPGNGEDCHRTWEALYMGSIPIVKKSAMTKNFSEKLPMYFYEKISDISFKKLKLFYSENKARFSTEPLTFSYWRELILAKKKELFPN